MLERKGGSGKKKKLGVLVSWWLSPISAMLPPHKGVTMRENLPILIAELKARMSTIRDSL
jgi:hypothetical protein